eukprot:scaffold3.g6660.t1
MVGPRRGAPRPLTRRRAAPPARAQPVDEAALSSLKEEGNQLFARKDYDKALETYDRALRLVAPDTPDAALLHSNKAACHMMFKKFKEAVNECTAALDSQPTFFKALVRRGKAYEQARGLAFVAMGLFKQALTDFQRANKLDTATTESREAEKRLRDIVTGKRSGAANGAKKAVPTKAPVCLGMYNQATVHQARAELLISKAAKSGAGAAGIVADVEKHLQLAEAKFDEALAYKASFLDGYLGKSHLAQLRGKLAAGYLVEVARCAHEVDIRNALKGHPLAEELADLIGPEPEPAKAEEGKEEGKQGGEAAAPKGLPALPKQGKKKDAAAA